jgi:hypothetical protein
MKAMRAPGGKVNANYVLTGDAQMSAYLIWGSAWALLEERSLSGSVMPQM